MVAGFASKQSRPWLTLHGRMRYNPSGVVAGFQRVVVVGRSRPCLSLSERGMLVNANANGFQLKIKCIRFRLMCCLKRSRIYEGWLHRKVSVVRRDQHGTPIDVSRGWRLELSDMGRCGIEIRWRGLFVLRTSYRLSVKRQL